MLEVLSTLVTRVLEPGTEAEVGDEDDEDEDEDVIMDIGGGAGDSVVEQAIALLNDKECVAFLVRVAETSIQQTGPTFSGEKNHVVNNVNKNIYSHYIGLNLIKYEFGLS